MSAVLRLNIINDLAKCINTNDVDNLRKKYNTAFTNAVDATEFNRMLQAKLMECKYNR